MKALYSTKATVTGGRAGKATLSDNDLSINMVPPGSDKEGNNPEQMFAIGYSACFDGALGAVKQMEKATFDSTTEIEVDLLQGDSHDYKLAAKIYVVGENTELSAQGDSHDYKLAAKIYVVGENTELSADEFQKLVEKAHQVCPYSKATRGNIDVEVTSEVK